MVLFCFSPALFSVVDGASRRINTGRMLFVARLLYHSAGALLGCLDTAIIITSLELIKFY